MKKQLAVLLTMGLLSLTGCAGPGKQAVQATPQAEEPKLVTSQDNFYVYDYQSRHYVVGSPESSEAFASHHHMPYAKTILGAGPKGQTVVYEVAKKDPSTPERLIEHYGQIPFVVATTGDDYTVFKYQGRLFVVGTAAMKQSFVQNHHLPYTKTLLGAGPAGETVVFQVDPKDPALGDRLMKQFTQQ